MREITSTHQSQLLLLLDCPSTSILRGVRNVSGLSGLSGVGAVLLENTVSGTADGALLLFRLLLLRCLLLVLRLLLPLPLPTRFLCRSLCGFSGGVLVLAAGATGACGLE